VIELEPVLVLAQVLAQVLELELELELVQKIPIHQFH
jgi:hypothetical protein